MIIDLETDAPTELEADLLIVGGGAAGVSIAHALIGSGLRVCLAESGGLAEEAGTQALYAGDSLGHPVDMEVGRYRLLGGSTNRWTGRCAWLDPIDFEARPWVPFSGWPIGLDELTPWYLKAEILAGFPRPWRPADEAPEGRRGLAGLGSAEVERFTWRYAPQPDGFMSWGRTYREALRRAGTVTALLHANVVDIAADGAPRAVRSMTVSSLDGRRATIHARAFVLGCGGVENARLLLQSARTVPGGLGNDHDQVGRYFMQHPRGRTGDLRPNARIAGTLQKHFNIFPLRDGVRHETGFALTEAAQRRHGLLNASAVLDYDEDPESAWASAKELLRAAAERGLPDRPLRRAALVGAGLPGVARNAWRKRRGSLPADMALSGASLLIDLEQTPDPDSRVRITDRTDRLGQARAEVDWRLSEQERRTAAHLTDAAAAEFGRLGLGALTPRPWLRGSGPIAAEDLAGTYHHIATTRMAADPRHGVVDADCRVHGTRNLHVAGCSTFSTGGHANPTLTIVALALRLAAHLRERLRA